MDTAARKVGRGSAVVCPPLPLPAHAAISDTRVGVLVALGGEKGTVVSAERERQTSSHTWFRTMLRWESGIRPQIRTRHNPSFQSGRSIFSGIMWLSIPNAQGSVLAGGNQSALRSESDTHNSVPMAGQS